MNSLYTSTGPITAWPMNITSTTVLPAMYRDENGTAMSVARLLNMPAAWKCWHDYAVEPELVRRIGSKDGLPVFVVTDVGGCLLTGDGPCRSVMLKLPGEALAHEFILPVPCTIPKRFGDYCAVHQITRETFEAMDDPFTPAPIKGETHLARLRRAAAAGLRRWGGLLMALPR